jgi:hypothetical protein
MPVPIPTVIETKMLIMFIALDPALISSLFSDNTRIRLPIKAVTINFGDTIAVASP